MIREEDSALDLFSARDAAEHPAFPTSQILGHQGTARKARKQTYSVKGRRGKGLLALRAFA